MPVFPFRLPNMICRAKKKKVPDSQERGKTGRLRPTKGFSIFRYYVNKDCKKDPEEVCTALKYR